MPYKRVEDRKSYERRYYLENRDKTYARTKAWDTKEHARDPLAHRVKRMYRDAKNRALKGGLTFNLQIDWLVGMARLAHEEFGFDLSSNKAGRMSMTLDRFDNELGYVESNVRIIPYWMNAAKRDCSVQEIEILLKYMKG